MNKEAVLGATQRLRVLCAFAKIEATVELTKTILESEPAVVIFTNFAKAAKQIHQHLADSGWCGELLIGDTPQKKRQGLVDNFQVSFRNALFMSCIS
jgi:SNF2 family DNA or RNA helicase